MYNCCRCRRCSCNNNCAVPSSISDFLSRAAYSGCNACAQEAEISHSGGNCGCPEYAEFMRNASSVRNTAQYCGCEG